MFRIIYYDPERCLLCHGVIKAGDKLAEIKVDEQVCYLHKDECLQEYKWLLSSPEEISKGEITGVCGFCCKPVRTEHDFYVRREGYGYEAKTTLPCKEKGHVISVMHKKCADEYDASLE